MKPEPVFVAPVEVVIKAEPEALAVPEVTGESKTSPVKAKGPKPKGTKRFKKLPMDEPEVKEEELSEHQKKKLETQRRKVEEAEAAKLAAELAELSDNDLKKFPGNEEVKHEIIACRGLKAGSRKRQIKYLAKVVRQYSLEEIYLYLKARKGSALQANQIFHQAERWRDVIINDAMEVYDACRRERADFEPDFHSTIIRDAIQELQDIDEKDLRRCTYQYVRTRNKTYYRELFRMIKAAIEGHGRGKVVERQ